ARRTDNQWTNADFFVGLTTTDQYFEDYSWNYVIPAWFPNMPAPPGPLGNGGYQVIHNNSNVPLDGVFHRYSNCFLSEDNWDRFVMYPVSTVQGNYTSVSVDNVSIIPLIPTINNQEISSLQMCPPISYSLGMSCEAEVVALNYSWISYHWEVVNNGIPQSDLTGLNQVINPTPPYPQTIDYTLIFEFIDDQGNYHVCPLGTITVEFSDIEVVADITNPLCYQLFGSIDLTPVGVPPYSYLWSTGATSQGITGLAGTYTVTITDNFPCTYVGTYLITEPPELIATVTLVTTTCTGVCDGEATILVTGGTPDYSYFITGPLGYSFTYTPTPPVPNPITLSGLCPGDYNYLIVDANGCLVEGTFTIVDGTGPIITIVNNSPPTPCASCCLGDVDITVTGGTAPYVIDISNYGTFNNIPSNISQPYTGLCPFGMYTVTVTDANGCTNIASFIYAAFPSVPWIVIDEPTECIYADDGFGVPSIATFSATEISNMDFHITQFEWDFGDGTPTVLSAPGVNVQHAFDVGSDYGYYCVSVTTHSCCAQQWTQGTTVFVHPNVCTCPNSIGYDFHTDVNIHSGTTENWTTINGADFGANLIIETGATLNLFECRLGFGPASKIIIEPGGVLNTDGTSVMPTRLTRADLIDVCYNLEYMWQGVEVWGNPDETSASPAQGRLIIQDNTIIEHAYIGVLLGARDENYICNPTWNMYDPYLSGGTIFSKDCDYEANGIAISFIEKNNRHGNNNLIMESNFLGRKIVSGSPVPLLDKRYFDGYATPYPNMQNPWAGDANFYCKGAEGISINQLEALTISSNSFDDIFRCIRAFDTGHSIRNCSFNNTKVGIEIRNSLFGVNNAHLITDNCTFDNLDPTGIPNRADGVFIEGGSFDKIENSVFGFNSIANDITVGIETMNSSDYTLVDNNLFNLSGGLFLRNTIIGASFVGNEDDLVGNIFNECRFGIFSGMTNTAVDVDCNSFIPVLTPNPFYNRNMKNNFGQFQNQGSGSDPVANLFNGSGYNKKLIRTEPTSIYVYWHFNGNQNNDPWVPTVESVFPANSGLIYNQSNACDDYIQPIMPIANNYQTIIDNLQMQYDNILANIDNGNTAELLGDIYGTMSNGQLKNKLLSNSPLSDEVLLALITEDRLSPGNYKNVMEVNLPVSDNVKPVFENYLLVLPPGIANQLAQLQAYNPGIITLTSIYQEIQHYISKRRNIVNSIINTEIFENNDINEAWQLLSGEEGLDVLRALYSKDYIEGDLISARARLEAMSAETQQQQDWITLQGILLDIKEDTLSLYELDSVQLDYFRQLAVLCDDGGLASSNARAILSYYYHEEYYCDWDPFSEPKSGKIENNNNPEQEFLNEEASLGQNYPNPFAKTTLIPYSLPDSENGVLKITNYEGKTISEINVSSKSYKVELKTKDWANGVYYYTLNIDGKTIDTKKMILIK
ncbi:MAG: T9SS type A sorting domain-containing protein, partial [Bacteroidota bacterium]